MSTTVLPDEARIINIPERISVPIFEDVLNWIGDSKTDSLG